MLSQKQIIDQKQRQQQIDQPIATQEIQSSIKEVTSAIVHYVNDQNRGSRSRSVSPSQRWVLCKIEEKCKYDLKFLK